MIQQSRLSGSKKSGQDSDGKVLIHGSAFTKLGSIDDVKDLAEAFLIALVPGINEGAQERPLQRCCEELRQHEISRRR